jgi:hypothetical protein
MKTIHATFPKSNLQKFYAKVDQVQKRAKKLKVNPIIVEVGEAYMGTWGAKVDGPYGMQIIDIQVQKVDVTISWEDELKLPSDHKLLAVLENVEGHTFVTSLLENRDFAEYRTHDWATCDHCGWKRNRKKSMLIDYQGKEMVIGSSCIVDYLGYNPSNALHCATMLKDFRDLAGCDDIYGTLPKYVYCGAIKSIVETAIMALEETNWTYIKGHGFDDDQIPTITRVFDSLGPNVPPYKFDKKYQGLADKILAHYNGLTEKLEKNQYLSDFEYKLAVLNKLGGAEGKQINIIIGSVGGMIKKLIKQQDEEKGNGPSEHIGSIKEKVELVVEVTRIHNFVDHSYSYYGTEKYIISGLANGKDKFSWFTGYDSAHNSGLISSDYSEEVGCNVDNPAKGKFKISATVKQHKDDKFGISTVLTRVKVLEKL